MNKFIYRYFPIITTREKQYKQTRKVTSETVKWVMDDCHRVERKCAWAAINPVISSLKELRKNTWDKDRVDQMIRWLTDNFEYREE